MADDAFARAARDAVRQLRRMPPELRRELSGHVRDRVAAPAAASVRASMAGPWAAQLAAGTRVRAGADPAVVIGGRRPVVSGGASVRQLVYGEQFGSTGRNPRARQFRRRGSRTVVRTFARDADRLFRAWLDVLDPLLDRWEGR